MSNTRTYVRVFDNLEDHPRWLEVGPAGIGLWLLSLGYCSRNLTDGLFAAALVRRWGAAAEDPAVAELLAAGRWHGPDHGCEDCPAVPQGKLYVHAYLEHQRSSEQVAELSAKRAEAGRRGGAARVAKQSAEQNPSTPKQPEAKGTPTADTDTKKDSPAQARAAAVAADFDAFWTSYPRKVGKDAAARAYTKARKTVDAATITMGLANAVQVWKSTDTRPEFIPHAATWLNGGRWADEVPLPDMPASKPVTLMQCNDDTPHDRHEREDNTRRYVCMGV